MNKIVAYVMDASMKLSHDGLRELATKQRPKIDLDTLKPGEFVLFTNVSFTAVKIFGAFNTFVYHRNREGAPMNPRALMRAVECFDGVKFDYKSALAKAIEDALSPELKEWLKTYRKEKPGSPVDVKLTKRGIVKVSLRRRVEGKRKGKVA